MSWAEIKKAVNSNLSRPLNELIEEQALLQEINQSSIDHILRTSKSIGSVLCRAYDIESEALKSCKNWKDLIEYPQALIDALSNGKLRNIIFSSFLVNMISTTKAAIEAVFSSKDIRESFFRLNSAKLFGEGISTYADLDYYVFRGETSIQNVFKKDEAMNELLSSSKAMEVLATTPYTANGLISNGRVGKCLVAYAGLSSSVFDSIQSIGTIVGGSTYYNPVVASEKAMRFIALSGTGILNFSNNNGTMNAIAQSPIALRVCAETIEAHSYLTKSDSNKTSFVDYCSNTVIENPEVFDTSIVSHPTEVKNITIYQTATHAKISPEWTKEGLIRDSGLAFVKKLYIYPGWGEVSAYSLDGNSIMSLPETPQTGYFNVNKVVFGGIRMTNCTQKVPWSLDTIKTDGCFVGIL